MVFSGDDGKVSPSTCEEIASSICAVTTVPIIQGEKARILAKMRCLAVSAEHYYLVRKGESVGDQFGVS